MQAPANQITEMVHFLLGTPPRLWGRGYGALQMKEMSANVETGL